MRARILIPIVSAATVLTSCAAPTALTSIPVERQAVAAAIPASPPQPPPPLQIRGAWTRWQVDTTSFGTLPARLAKKEPCLKLRYDKASSVTWCLVGRSKISVRHFGQQAYEISAVRRVEGSQVTFRIRTADLMLPKGKAVVIQRCRAVDCKPPRYGEKIRVPRLVLRSCKASDPWYVRQGPGDEKAVALTFDDGPGLDTPAVLDQLRDLGVPGTFFVIGQNVASRQDVLRRIAREGHMIGNHTWSHPDLTRISWSSVQQQLQSTTAIIRKTIGMRTCVFRAPYGAESGSIIETAKSMGMVTTNWNVDPRDWTGPGSGAIAYRVTSATTLGSIPVMHDGTTFGHQTAAALPSIVSTLRGRGYRFLTLAELLDLRTHYY